MEDQIDVVRKTEMMWFMAAGRQNAVICGAEDTNNVIYGHLSALPLALH